MPSDEDTLGDKDRIIKALEEKYTNVVMPYNVVKTLYPMCRNSSFKITVTMIKKEYNWLITKVESGNTSKNHYGLAVDLGSTTIIMQLVDLNNGQVIAEESTFNKQIKYGEDILSRIFYTKQYEDGLKEIQNSTIESFKELIDKLENKTNIEIKSCGIMTVAGNTTMMHFLLGINP